MPRLPQPRPGEPLYVRGRPLPFSFFPVRRNTRRYGLHDVVFAVDPWAVIEGAISDEVAAADRDETRAFVAQARAFYEAAASRTPASPLLYYYAFLNLGKVLVRCRGYTGSLDRAHHGLGDGRVAPAADLTSGTVSVRDDPSKVNVFPEVVERLGYSRPIQATIPIPELAAQVVVGHRLWRAASNRSERFVVLQGLEFIDDPGAKQLWLRLWIRRGDLSRYGISHAQLVREGGLSGVFAETDSRSLTGNSDLICLEQVAPIAYSGRPTDVAQALVDRCRPWLWRIITAGPEDGYRRYYLHLTPATELHRQPQVAAMWMLIFFFGSVVRYRPQAFSAMARGRYGAWINDFVAAQPEQLLFMLASEIRRREVARPSIV